MLQRYSGTAPRGKSCTPRKRISCSHAADRLHVGDWDTLYKRLRRMGYKAADVTVRVVQGHAKKPAEILVTERVTGELINVGSPFTGRMFHPVEENGHPPPQKRAVRKARSKAQNASRKGRDAGYGYESQRRGYGSYYY